MIDLISDTVTKPSPKMREAMANATVGDDVFGQDPTVRALEEKGASIFGKEAGLFCPSGTMTNQIAIKCHTQPLDEMICDHWSHVYQYETGGYAFHSGIAVNLIEGAYGKINSMQIREAIKDDQHWLPNSKLVVLENTCNRGGGTIYRLDEMSDIAATCKELNLKLHLDGARIFNALVETEDDPKQVGALFNSISICLSKGLGAPIGSLLLGDHKTIRFARKVRKVMGGGMRQAGIIAAGGLYALEYNIDRLKEDNDRARRLGDCLSSLDYVDSVRPVETNIVIFDVIDDIEPTTLVEYLKENNINSSAFGKQSIRLVTHLDIDDVMIEKVCYVLERFEV